MASTYHEILPNSDDADSSNDWSVQSSILFDDLHSCLASTTSTRYIKSSTNGVRNYFGFENLSVTPTTTPPIHHIQYVFTYSSDTASETFSLFVGIVDGGDSDTILWSDSITLTAPSNTGKVNTYTSPIFPYHSGTTAWSVDNINDLKVFIRLLDNDTGGSASSVINIKTFKYLVTTNDSDSTAISTYPAKKGMKVSRGVINIGD